MMKYLVALVAVLLISGPFALAQSIDCDAPVTDRAAVFGGGTPQVQTAAQELENAGVDLRVLTVASFAPQGNLDQFERTLEQSCASWQAANGGRKNNLVVLIVAVQDRKVGLYYGDVWKPVLDGHWTRILTDDVTPRFRDGDFAAGVTAGLRSVTRLVRPGGQPPAPSAPVVVEREPVDLTGLWRILGWALAAAVLLVGFVLLRPALRTRRKEWEERRGAQAAARSARAACASAVLELGEARRAPLSARADALGAHVAEEDLQHARDLLRRLDNLVEDGASRYADLTSSASDPDRDLTTTEYRHIQTEFAAVAKVFEEARAQKREIEAELQDLEQALAQSDARLAATKQALDDAQQEISRAQAQGFKAAAAVDHLSAAEGSLAAAETGLQERRVHRMMTALRSAEEGIRAATGEARSQAEMKAALEKSLAALRERLPTVTARIQEGRTIFEEIAAAYAPATWRTVRGNGTEAEKRVEATTPVIEEVAGLLAAQEWPSAAQAIAQANGSLDEAESFMRSLVALRANLLAAKQDAPREIDLAAKDVHAASEYTRLHDADVAEELEDRLRRAEKRLEDAQVELKTAQPDYLLVLKSAKEANAEADAVLDAARSEHEQAERRRQKATRAIRDARRAVSAAQEYIEDHRTDIPDSMARDAREAGEALGKAEQTEDLDERIRLAEAADSRADLTLQKAESEVHAAEARRHNRRGIPVDSGRDWHGGAWGSPSSRRSGGSGGSQSFGHSVGGGGSVGFGGGGGGSKGW